MSVRMRHTKGHTRNRRSHHALTSVRLSTCSKCSQEHIRHRACLNCGTYRGREVIDVSVALTKAELKKQAKADAKAAAAAEEAGESANAEKPLDPQALSKK